MLFNQIAKNERKSKWLMSIFFILIVLFGNLVGSIIDVWHGIDTNGITNVQSMSLKSFLSSTITWQSILETTIISIIVVSIYMFIVLHKSINIIMAMNHGQEITNQQQCPALWNAVSNLSIAAGLPMPKVFIINDPSPNAFSTGNNPKNSAIGATTGLLKMMNQYEIEGVIGHEMSHIKDHDTRVETIGIALTSIFAFIGGLLFRLLADASWFDDDDNDDDDGGFGIAILAGMVLVLISWICCGISYLAQMALSRNREYLADAGSVNLTRNPEEIIDALKLLENRPSMKKANPSSNALYLVNPHKPKHKWSIANLFDTHPPLAKRIQRLEQMEYSAR